MNKLMLTAALLLPVSVSAAGLVNYGFNEESLPNIKKSVIESLIVVGTVDMPPENCSGVLTIDRTHYPDKPLKTGQLAFELANRGKDMRYHTGFVGQLISTDGGFKMSLVNLEYSPNTGLDNPKVTVYARDKKENWREYYNGYVDTHNCSVHLKVSKDGRDE